MLQDVIIYRNSCFYKREKRTNDGLFKIGYYDNISGDCLCSSIDKGRITTEHSLKCKLKKFNIIKEE